MKRVLALLLILSPLEAVTQDSIAPDRPSFSNSSATVGKNTYQMESGVAETTTQNASGTRTFTTQIPVLLRAGVTKSVEARLATNGYTWQRVDTVRTQGFEDISLGFKWHMRNQTGWVPAIGSLGSGEFSTAARPLAGRGFQPTLQLPLDWSLPENSSLTVMPGAAYVNSASHEEFLYGQLSIVACHGWTSRLQTFVEWAGRQFTLPKNGGSIESADIGLTFLVLPDVQLDSSIWWGLTRQSAPVFWTIGFSARVQP